MNKSCRIITKNGIIEILFPICGNCKENPIEYHKNYNVAVPNEQGVNNPFGDWHKVDFEHLYPGGINECTIKSLFNKEIKDIKDTKLAFFKEKLNDFYVTFLNDKQTLLCSKCLTNLKLIEFGDNDKQSRE